MFVCGMLSLNYHIKVEQNKDLHPILRHLYTFRFVFRSIPHLNPHLNL